MPLSSSLRLARGSRRWRPVLRRLLPVLAALAAVIFAIGGLMWLDGLEGEQRRGQELLSKQLDVRREYAQALLAADIQQFREAARLELEIERERANIWLEYAGGRKPVDQSEEAKKSRGTLGGVAYRQARLARLLEVEEELKKSPRPARPAFDKVIERIDSFDHAKEKVKETVKETASAAPLASAPWSARLLDPASPLHHVYQAAVFGLVGIIVTCGLYACYAAARLFGLRLDIGKIPEGLLARSSGTAAALVLGVAATGGAAAIGAGIGAADGETGGSELAALGAPGGSGGRHISHAHGPTTIGGASDNRSYLDSSSDAAPVLELPDPLPTITARLGLDPAWERSASSISAASASLKDTSDSLGKVTTELAALVPEGKSYRQAFQQLSETMQTVKAALDMHRTALSELRNTDIALNANVDRLARSTAVVDCNWRRAARLMFTASVHSGDLSDAVETASKKSDCLDGTTVRR